jgi:hypothetical protein
MARCVKLSKRSAPGLTLELKPSRWLLAWVLGTHALAIIAVWLAPFPLTVQAPLTLALCALAMWTYRRDPARRFQRLHWFADGGAELTSRLGVVTPLDLISAPVSLPVLTTLELRRDGRVIERFALFADSARGDDLRALRVRLKHGA